MSASPSRVVLLLVAVAAAVPSPSRAQTAGVQGNFFSDNYNFQLFEPFDIDLDNVPVRDRAGYIFRFDKLYWAPSSERTTLGAPGLTVPSEIFFPDNPFSDGNTIPPYDVINDIQDAPPQSEFGWGERYEFGYKNDRGVSLTVGVLDGPTSSSVQTFGFDPVAVDIFGNVVQGTPFGFGSVHVNFITPPGLFTGFRDLGVSAGDVDDGDVDLDGLDAPIEFVIIGPGFNENLGFIDSPTFPFVPDQDVDNLDGDETGGAFVLLDAMGNFLGFGTDFDDLHTFNLRFEQLEVRNVFEVQGIELMKTFTIDNRNQLRRQQNSQLQIGYGFRLMRLKDDFIFSGNADLNGQYFIDTDADNQVLGPQIRAQYTQSRGAWTFDLDGRFMAGVNFQDIGLIGGAAESAIPGGLNQSLIFQPTFTAIGQRRENFSPLIELRLQARYQISQSIALRTGYTAMFIDNITRASAVTGYTLPNYSLLQGGEQNVFFNGLNFGVEATY